MASQATAEDGGKSSRWSARYRGATVEDLDPPPALSVHPSDTVSHALLSAFERDYTHLTVVDSDTRALVGYVAVPQLQAHIAAKTSSSSSSSAAAAAAAGEARGGDERGDDAVSTAMTRFQRKGRRYRVITMQTPLEELEDFFRGKSADDGVDSSGPSSSSWAQEFAVVTDENRRFVLGVVTVQDLEEFVKKRPV